MNRYLEKHSGKALLILIIFFIVGAGGMILDSTRELFISLTPIALLLSLLVIIISHQPQKPLKEILIFLSIGLVSFIIEAAGVATGMIFGSYEYGDGLGIKVINTPILIGVNWIFLIYCTAVITDRLAVAPVLKIILSSSIMVAYDFLMEQVAPLMRMWVFENGSVPLKNYVAWFLLAIIFHSILKLAGIKVINRLAPAVFFIQVVFFMILAIFFKLAE